MDLDVETIRNSTIFNAFDIQKIKETLSEKKELYSRGKLGHLKQ